MSDSLTLFVSVSDAEDDFFLKRPGVICMPMDEHPLCEILVSGGIQYPAR